jgi:hypothetical protein
MSIERITTITTELFDLCAELHRIRLRILPLVEELQTNGIELPPEVQAMLLALKPQKIQAC